VLSFNLWTGGPMLAIWIGSRVQGSGPLTTAALGVVVAVLAAISWVIVRALAGLNLVYDRLTGRSRARRRTPWLRSMRAGRDEDRDRTVTAADMVVIAVVLVAVAAFEVWFFFYSGSPIDQRSGRS
jgi:hypothetical protein